MSYIDTEIFSFKHVRALNRNEIRLEFLKLEKKPSFSTTLIIFSMEPY